MIFAFEGIDGAGKTTLLEKVYDELKARGVRVFKTYEPFGEYRKMLKRKTPRDPLEKFFLLMACRAQMQDYYKRNKDNIVLVDRYIYSTYAYQIPAGVDVDLIEYANYDFIEPNLTFWLDTPIEECQRRLEKRGRDNDDKYSVVTAQIIRSEYKNLFDYNDNILKVSEDQVELIADTIERYSIAYII